MSLLHSRRRFLKNSSLLSAALMVEPSKVFTFVKPYQAIGARCEDDDAANQIITVTGAISEPGFTLVHEHVLVDFIGADKASPDRYNADEVFETALPKLKDLQSKGCKTFVDCTPAYLGRDVRLLKRLSVASGLNIVSNTGFYGAAKEMYLPKLAYSETAASIAKRWISEFENGVDGSTIKPGFIKCAVDSYPLSPTQTKMIEAAAITHLATGLTIYVHTGNGLAAKEELKIINRFKVHPSAWVWVHAQSEADRQVHLEMARAGAWISFDGVNVSSIKNCIQFLDDMKENKLLNRVLLSQDSGWYNVGQAKGGKFNDYNTIHDKLIPELKTSGYTQEDLDLLFKVNPRKALSVAIRKR